jgi:putative DNA methylase
VLFRSLINQELDLFFTEQDGELDRDSRFCVDLYTQYAFNDVQFGEADVLARAKNTSVERLVAQGALYAQKGVVRLLTREEIKKHIDPQDEFIWLLTQQLTQAMETGGVDAAAKIVAEFFGMHVEQAKALAYRLYTISERKGWADEAFAYNSLVVAWPDVQSKAAELMSRGDVGEQLHLPNMEE